MRAPAYGYYEKEAPARSPLRRIVAPLLLFLLFFFVALCVQQAAAYAALSLAGGRPAMHLGSGALLSRIEAGSEPIYVHAQWWSGPRAAPRMPIPGVLGRALLFVGPFVNVLFIALIAANMRRGPNELHYVSLAANGAAVLTALAGAVLTG